MEKMVDFFTSRVDGYDEHMLFEVAGCKEAYQKLPTLIPTDCKALLDLGCGTGLELYEIFKIMPMVHVTGIDLTQAMLDKLKEKYAGKQIQLICGSYFDIDFGNEQYQCAISFQTMHHFSKEAKIGLYQRILASLNENGVYIECDYMVEKQEDEDFYAAENIRIRKEMKLSDDEFYHYDTPCTIENQIAMLTEAGFHKVERVFRIENTTIIIAYK